MAKRNSNVVALKQPSAKRRELAAEASTQLERLLGALLKQTAPVGDGSGDEKTPIEPAILEAVAIRGRVLNDIMFNVIAGDEHASTEDLARELGRVRELE